MSIEYKGYQIEGGEKGNDGVVVTVRFRVVDIPAAEQLITGCRSLGARSKEQATEPPTKEEPKAEEPKPRPKLAAVPTPPASDVETSPLNGITPPAKAKKAAALPAQPPFEGSGEADDKDAHADEDEDEGKPAAKSAQPANGNGKRKLTVTKEMREGTFRIVCSELAKQGFNTKGALLDVLPKLREHVGAVKAVPDEQLQARVEAAVDILGLGS